MVLGGSMTDTPKQLNAQARKAAREAGERFYQGMDCKYEHGGLRYTNGGACVRCCRFYSMDFNQRHPRYYKDRQRTPELIARDIQRKKIWASKNKEHLAEYQKKYQEKYTATEEGKLKRREAARKYDAKKRLEKQEQQNENKQQDNV